VTASKATTPAPDDRKRLEKLWPKLPTAPDQRDDMLDALVQLRVQPTRDNYLALHAMVTAHASYQPYHRTFKTVQKQLSQRVYMASLVTLWEAMPTTLLSPRNYMLQAEIFQILNRPDDAAFAKTTAFALVQAIMATGDGSEAKPWVVSLVSDEYDVLAVLGKTRQRQSLMRGEDDDSRRFDVITTTEGEEYWFEVTSLFGR